METRRSRVFDISSNSVTFDTDISGLALGVDRTSIWADISNNRITVNTDISCCRIFDLSSNTVTCLLDVSGGGGPKLCFPGCCECVCEVPAAATAAADCDTNCSLDSGCCSGCPDVENCDKSKCGVATAAATSPAPATAPAVVVATEPPEKKSVVARRMIAEVEEALKTESPASVAARFVEYQQEFPKLFAILLNRDYPRDVLSMMLSQLEKVESGRTSQHDASVVVGGALVNQFVKPQLGLSNPK